MKSKKVTMLAAALVVAVVAAAGIGFAITYTATTTNSNNTLNSTYMTLSQTSDVQYATGNLFKAVYFDTEKTSDASTTYIPVYDYYKTETGTQIVEIPTDHQKSNSNTYYEKISQPLTLKLDKKNSAASSIKLTVTASNFSPVTGFKYVMVLSTTSTDVSSKYFMQENSGSTWTFTTVNIPEAADGSITFAVDLFVTGTVSGTTAPTTLGFNTNGTDGSDSVFTFKAEAASMSTDGPANNGS